MLKMNRAISCYTMVKGDPESPSIIDKVSCDNKNQEFIAWRRKNNKLSQTSR